MSLFLFCYFWHICARLSLPVNVHFTQMKSPREPHHVHDCGIWVVSRVYGVMSHIWMGHVAHTNSSWIKSYARMRHVSYLMRVISLVPYLHVSCHIYECVMSHIWIGHVTYMKVSYLCTSFTANEKSEWEWFLLLSLKWYHHDDNIIMGITIIGTIIVALMIIGINQSNHSHHQYLSPPMRCVISGLF